MGNERANPNHSDIHHHHLVQTGHSLVHQISKTLSSAAPTEGIVSISLVNTFIIAGHNPERARTAAS